MRPYIALLLAVSAPFSALAQTAKTPAEVKADLVQKFSTRTAPVAADYAAQSEDLKKLYALVAYVQGPRDDTPEKYAKMVRSVGYALGLKPGKKLEDIVKLYNDAAVQRVVAATNEELLAREAIVKDLSERNARATAEARLRGRAALKTIKNFSTATDNLKGGKAADGGFVVGGGGPAVVAVAYRPDLVTTKTNPSIPPSFQPLTGFRTSSQAPTTPVVDGNRPKPSFMDRISSAYGTATAYVAEKIDAARSYVTAKGREVKNRFFRGVELLVGYGYDFLFPGRHRNFGTEELTTNLATIAAYMKSSGGAQTDMMIGDISQSQGGPIGHLSHQKGVDVDIGFYMVDAKTGQPYKPGGMVTFDRNLRGYDGNRAVRFDSKRNWELVKAIIANPDPKFRPTYIFIATHLEAAILAESRTEDAHLRKRAAELMSYWPNHDNHLHLRIE